jgi:Ca2+-binding EF-hand superfamily protein
MVVAPRPAPGQEHLIKFHEDPRRTIPVEYQGQFTIWEAYDLIDKFNYYDVDGSGCIDAEELKLLLGDFDAEPATINKIMGAIDGNRNGQVEFDEVRK